MAMSISALMHQTKFANSPHPVLAIDGLSLDIWLSSKINQPDILNLVPAQGWLLEDQDLETAWRRLTPYGEECSTITPLLICPDDMDFVCTTVVVEQEVTIDKIIWLRFGFAFDRPGDQVGATVKWFRENSSVRFNRSEFEQAVVQLKLLTDTEWS
jgi:hypothetical protein